MKNKGFTLVELAIVLVIVGLLIGGVLQGQELIKQAQLRNVISTLREYDTAVNTFRAKYNNALPGDWSQATAFGKDTNFGDCNFSNQANAGDGDGVLESGLAGGCSGQVSFSGEMSNFFVALSNEGLVKGSFVQGTAALSAATTVTTSAGIPSLAVGGMMIALSDTGNSNNLNYVLGLTSGFTPTTIIGLGALANRVTPENAYSLDIKMDDGTPYNGIMQHVSAYSTAGVFSEGDTEGAATCASANGTTGVYNAGLTTNVCTIRIRASS